MWHSIRCVSLIFPIYYFTHLGIYPVTHIPNIKKFIAGPALYRYR